MHVLKIKIRQYLMSTKLFFEMIIKIQSIVCFLFNVKSLWTKLTNYKKFKYISGT